MKQNQTNRHFHACILTSLFILTLASIIVRSSARQLDASMTQEQIAQQHAVIEEVHNEVANIAQDLGAPDVLHASAPEQPEGRIWGALYEIGRWFGM